MKTKEPKRKSSVLGAIRLYISVIRILHRDLGALRIIAAYTFFAFAVLSLMFTIKTPVSRHFLTPDDAAKMQSRGITGLIMIMNLIVYGMIMNWRRGNAARTAIRIALIGLTICLDVFLIQISYILVYERIYY